MCNVRHHVWSDCEKKYENAASERRSILSFLPVWVCSAALGCLPDAQLPVWSLCTEAPVEPAQDPQCWLPPARLKSKHVTVHQWSFVYPGKRKQEATKEHPLVQPCALQCVGSAVYLSSTRVDSRWPRDTASSKGVRPLGSARCRSCCGGTHATSIFSAMQYDTLDRKMSNKPTSAFCISWSSSWYWLFHTRKCKGNSSWAMFVARLTV